LSSSTEISPSLFVSNDRKAFSAASASFWAFSASRADASALSFAAMERSLSISSSSSGADILRGAMDLDLVLVLVAEKVDGCALSTGVEIIDRGATEKASVL
jgi:hypothetical protein